MKYREYWMRKVNKICRERLQLSSSLGFDFIFLGSYDIFLTESRIKIYYKNQKVTVLLTIQAEIFKSLIPLLLEDARIIEIRRPYMRFLRMNLCPIFTYGRHLE